VKKLWSDLEKLWYTKRGIISVYISINVLHLFNLLFGCNPFLRCKSNIIQKWQTLRGKDWVMKSLPKLLLHDVFLTLTPPRHSCRGQSHFVVYPVKKYCMSGYLNLHLQMVPTCLRRRSKRHTWLNRCVNYSPMCFYYILWVSIIVKIIANYHNYANPEIVWLL